MTTSPPLLTTVNLFPNAQQARPQQTVPLGTALERAEAMSLHDFFTTLYPDITQGYLVVSWPDPYRLTAQGKHALRSEWVNLQQRPWPVIADAVLRRGQSASMYFGVALQHPDCEPSAWRRGKNTTASVVPGLWCDLDVQTGQHAASTLPPTQAEAAAFLKTLPMPPSLLVDTGGGVHGYWLFDTPYVVSSVEQLHTIAHLSKQFTLTLVHRGQAYGWTLDALGDLARVLRPPGTLNTKYGTVVTVVERQPWRYALEAFGWLDPLPTPGPRTPGEGLSGQPALDTVVAHYLAQPLAQKSATEQAGPHPQHGSSTGDNFNVNPAKGLWHCWRHGTGGDALTLIAVCENLLPCEDARPGCLRGELFRRVLTQADALFGTTLLHAQQRNTPHAPWYTTARPWSGALATISSQEVPSWH